MSIYGECPWEFMQYGKLEAVPLSRNASVQATKPTGMFAVTNAADQNETVVDSLRFAFPDVAIFARPSEGLFIRQAHDGRLLPQYKEYN